MKLKSLLSLCLLALASAASADEFIQINTDRIGLVLRAEDGGRLYQSYLGKRLAHESDLQNLPKGTEAYLTHGMEDYFEPAIEVRHNDANPSLLLKYVSHTSKSVQPGVNETVITLQDDKYPVTVKLHYVAYTQENIIKTFTEISHQEKKPLKLERYASAMLHFSRPAYYLTEFSGDWIYEATMSTTPLNFGKKVLDTKLGARANMFTPPMFILSLDKESTENEGEVILGTLGWTGNFRFTFEVDNKKDLRVIAGINPYFSEYELPKGETFRTPDFYFTYSDCGRGQASRDFHDWARKYQLKDGQGDRMTLLNNWEATAFDFNEDKLVGLMDDAVKLGVDMFLLDDGWFGNKHERHSDTQGLGDGVDRYCTVESIGKDSLVFKVDTTEKNLSETRNKITLYQALIKGSKTDFVVQKAVETGIFAVKLFVSQNVSEKEVNVKRLERIALEAAKQCGRAIVPKVEFLPDFKSVLKEAEAFSGNKIMAYENESKVSVNDIGTKILQNADTLLLVGSEGGFTPDEAEKASNAGFCVLSLGKRILRADTASVVSTALILYKLGAFRI